METEGRFQREEGSEDYDVDFDVDAYLVGALARPGSSGQGGRKGRKPGEATSDVPLRSTQLYAALDDALAQLTSEQTITPELATHVRSVFDSTAPGIFVKADNFASGQGTADPSTVGAGLGAAIVGTRQRGRENGEEEARKKKPPILVTGKVENYSGIANNWSVSVKGAKITCSSPDGHIISKRSVRELELLLTVSLRMAPLLSLVKSLPRS